MRLEELVPPIELCKKIPEGEFEDSFAKWVVKWSNAEINGEKVDTITGVIPMRTIIKLPQHPTDEQMDLLKMRFPGAIVCKEYYPAPMLEEVMVAIGSDGKTGHCIDVYNIQGEWSGYCDQITTDEYNPLFAKEKSGSTTALKLWLKLKGVEDESLD